MSPNADGSGGGSRRQSRAGLHARLRARRGELEEAIFARFGDIGHGPGRSDDAEYTQGLRAAVAAAVEYGLTGIERGREASSAPIPSVAVEQAHRAARGGVALGTVLRRYVAGNSLLGEFVAAEADGVPSGALSEVARTQGVLLDRVMEAITAEYRREVERVGRSPGVRRAERVRELLAGASADAAGLGYEIVEAWHVGVIATGAPARQAVRELAGGVDCQLLSVAHGERTEWAWLGGRRRPGGAEIDCLLAVDGAAGVLVAIGEPGQGLDGWRRTHRQAQEALRVALLARHRVTRYADVPLLAAALRDDVLSGSLHELYLAPLERQRDGGASARETLRAYFAAGRNSSSAASALGVSRRTVGDRLGRIEQLLGRPLQTCMAELEVALRLRELGPSASADRATP